MRFLLLILSLLPGVSSFAQQDFTRFYGERFSADDELGYLIEEIQGQPTVIGLRQDPVSGQSRIGGFSFDPLTGAPGASYQLDREGQYFLQQSWPTPEGGFIINYFSVAVFGTLITYVNPDFTERWTRRAPTNYGDPINYTFDKDGTVILLYAANGQIGQTTEAIRYDADSGDILGNVDLMLFGNDAPLHLTPLAEGEGYLMGGQEFVDGFLNDRAFLRRVTDDFEEVWVDYVDNIGNGRMFSIGGATLTDAGEIWATGYVGVGFFARRGLLRYSPDGDLLDQDILVGAASTVEKITWNANGFLAQGNTNGFGNFYCAVDVKDGGDATVLASYLFGLASNPDPELTYSSALFLPAEGVLLAVVDNLFDNPGDRQMLVDRTVLETEETTRLDFGLVGGNQDEYARQIVRHPNGRDWVILASGGRLNGVPAGAQLTVIDPDNGDVRDVVYPSNRISGPLRQFISTRPDGQLLVGESEDDVATFSVLDENLEVTDQFDQPNNLQFATSFNGLSLRDGRFVVTQDLFNPAGGSDHQLVFHAADGTALDSVFVGGYLNRLVQLNDDQLLVVSENFTNPQVTNSSSVQSFDLTTGARTWRDNVAIGECQRTRITDVQRVLGDRLAVVVYSFFCGGDFPTRVQYRLYSAEGELEAMTLLPVTYGLTGIPRLSPRADGGEISVAFPENPEEGTSNVRLFRLNSASGTLLSDTTFTGFNGNNLAIEDLEYLRGNRLAILGTGQSEPTPSSFDIMLLVTDSEQLVGTSDRTLNVGVSLSPNPTPNLVTVTLSGTENSSYDLRLLTTDGRLVARTQVRGTGGTAEHVFRVGQLPAGMYTVAITDATGRLRAERFVKE